MGRGNTHLNQAYVKRRTTTHRCHAPTHARIQQTGQSNKLPNLVIHHIQLTLQLHSQSPGISSNDAIPLSAKSNSGFWISFASSIIFLVFNIFAFGIHETGACSITARAAGSGCFNARDVRCKMAGHNTYSINIIR